MKDTDTNTKETFSPFLQLSLFIGLSIAGISIFYALGMLLAYPIFGIPKEELSLLLKNYSHINLLKFFQLMSQIGLFITPPLAFYLIIEKKIIKPLYLNQLPTQKSFFFAFLLAFTILPVINLLSVWNQEFQLPKSMEAIYNWMVLQEKQNQLIATKLLEGTSVSVLLSNLFIIALMPAIGEELFFRGVLQKLFIKWFKNAHIAILVTAILFSALHLQFFGFLPRTLLGIIFGYYFYWSKSLWLPIFGHFVNNASAVVVAYYFNIKNPNMSYEDFGNYNDNTLLIVLNLALSLFLMFFIYREEILRKHKRLKV